MDQDSAEPPEPVGQSSTGQPAGLGPSDEFGGPVDAELTDQEQFLARSRSGLSARGPGGFSFHTWHEGDFRSTLLWTAPAGALVDGLIWWTAGTEPGIAALIFMALIIIAASRRRR